MEAQPRRFTPDEPGPGRATALAAAVLLLAVPWAAAADAGAASPGAEASGTSSPCGRTGLDVSLVLDRSGSMDGEKIEAAKDGARFLVDQLTGVDRSGLVSYDDDVRLDQTLTSEHGETREAVAGLTPGGTTATGDAIDLAHDDLEDNGRAGAAPTMVVLTDGHTNEGPHPVPEAEEAKADGVEIYAIGLGPKVDENVLEDIASSPTDEHYFHPSNASELRDVFRQVTGALAGSVSASEAYGLRGQVSVGGPVQAGFTLHRTNQSLYPTGGQAAVGDLDRSVAGLHVEARGLASRADGQRGTETARTEARARLADVQVRFQGDLLLEARGLSVRSASHAAADGPAASAGGTNVTALRLPDGTTLEGPFDPGTRIPLGEAGTVTVNETVLRTGPHGSSLRVNALHLELEPGNVSADLVLGSAYSSANCGPQALPVPPASPPEAVSVDATTPASGEEDPPQGGLEEGHDPLASAPGREVEAGVPGLVEVSRSRTTDEGSDYRIRRDTVTVEVVPASTTVRVVYYAYSDGDDTFRSAYDSAFVHVCSPDRCTGAGAGFEDFHYAHDGCEGDSSYLFASTPVADAAYVQWREGCGSDDGSTGYQCREAGAFGTAGGAASAGRCSEETRREGEVVRNENTYYAGADAAGVTVYVDHTNGLADEETRTRVIVQTPFREEAVTAHLPPHQPVG